MGFSSDLLQIKTLKTNDVTTPVGGRLSSFLPQWSQISTSPFVKNIISQGYKLEFSECPPSRFYITALPRDQEKASAMMNLLQDLIQQEVIIQVPKQQEGRGFYSHIFLVKKPSGKYRLILNLKILNRSIRYKHFRMDTIYSITKLLSPGCFMASLDLRDAYLHVPIAPASQKFLRLAINLGTSVWHLQFRALPFGLSSSPRVFTKIMAEALEPLKLRGISVVPYLDDLLFFADSRDQLVTNLQTSQTHLKNLGWILNLEKSHLDPSREMRFLGYTLNSVVQKVSCLRKR